VASSEVDLCNSALIHLGAGLITSLTDNSDEARACNQFFDGARDAVLTQSHWNFATTQAELSKLSGTPLYKYGFKYLLPVDPYCLKVLNIENPEEDTLWMVKGREIHTDRDGLKIDYIYRNTDVSQWTPLFVIALEYFLAHRMAYAITGSRAVAADMKELYDDALSDAEDVNAQEGNADEVDSNDFIDVRG
jgi:hypothetical protein